MGASITKESFDLGIIVRCEKVARLCRDTGLKYEGGLPMPGAA
jgi:hypothetical protein